MGIENPIHLLFLGAVALLVLGPKRLPDVAKALGNGIREFRDSISTGGEGEEPVSPNGAPPNGAPPPATPPPATQQTAPPPGPAPPGEAPPPADGPG